MSTIKKLTEGKRKKLGSDGFYDIITGTFKSKTPNGIKTGQSKGLYYDMEYGVLGPDEDTVLEFIGAEELEKLPEDWLDQDQAPRASPASGSASASAISSGGGGRRTSPKSPDQIVQLITAKLQALEPGKYVNISSLRSVKAGKEGFLYNNQLRLCAPKDQAQLLAEVVTLMGGSLNGGLGDDEERKSEDQEVKPQRVRAATGKNGRKVYGTPSALAAFGAGQAPAREPIEPRPASVTAEGIRPFAAKKPLNTSFTLAKP